MTRHITALMIRGPRYIARGLSTARASLCRRASVITSINHMGNIYIYICVCDGATLKENVL